MLQLPTSVAQQLTSLRRLRARTLALAQPTWALLCERCPCLEELEVGASGVDVMQGAEVGLEGPNWLPAG